MVIVVERFRVKKTSPVKPAIHSKLSTSFRRALRLYESEAASDLKVAKKGISDTLLTLNDLQRINAHLLKVEKQKAYGIQLILERQRCR